MSAAEYPADWHRTFGMATEASAEAILPPLLALFGTSSTAEIGCGNAHWSKVAREHGVSSTKVVDGPWNARADLLVNPADFVEADLAKPLELHRRFDLVICLEVAEHVASESAHILVKSLTQHADVILFGAAIPYQGGYGHINERWPSWWRDLFNREGFSAYDIIRPKHWHNRSIHYWYRQNSFLYIRDTNASASRIAAAEQARVGRSTFLFDAVHPEKFEEVASYEAIALKRLARRLPYWLAKRLRRSLDRSGL